MVSVWCGGCIVGYLRLGFIIQIGFEGKRRMLVTSVNVEVVTQKRLLRNPSALLQQQYIGAHLAIRVVSNAANRRPSCALRAISIEHRLRQ